MSRVCSVCANPDFKKCACPWHLPFDKWPHKLLEIVRAKVFAGSHDQEKAS